MKRMMRLAAAAVAAAGGLGGAVGCAGGPSVQNRYANFADPCWPERYAYEARNAAVAPFAVHVSNGNIVDHTLANYHFEQGSDRLTPGGMQKLDYLTRRRPAPDKVVYLQTARDVAFDPAAPDQVANTRLELDARRAAAVQKYVAATTAGRAVAMDVQVIDPPEMTTSAQGQANAVRAWPAQYTAAIQGQGGAGAVTGTGSGTGAATTTTTTTSGGGTR